MIAPENSVLIPARCSSGAALPNCWSTMGCTSLPFLNSEVHHIFRQCSQTNLLKLELRYFTPFMNAKAMNGDESVDFAHLKPKVGCHGNIPWTKKQMTGCSSFTFVNSGVTGPKFTKLTYKCTHASSYADELHKNQNGNIAIHFGIPGRRLKVRMGWFRGFCP